ncbi:demethylmenaquinone methyltransferase [Nakamurella lactea]|uniref:demethylmenaquinone methyltransferase n=1 Tax=Nakamurella lactea TaxID=459515 RepID=UPI0003F89018|nr:demethylmenaquinone methyltransferase [Nakamurella lactea]
MGRADLDKQPRQVAAMFDGVAQKYDRTNTLLSLGQDRRWRRHMVAALSLEPGHKVLDVAAGTAVSTQELAATGAWAVAADFSLGMLQAGRAKRGSLPMAAADALALPFEDATFDALTISFGLRNVVDPERALTEFARVVRPGGQLLVCEFSRPYLPMRWGYRFYLRQVLPRVAKRFGSNPEAYTYLSESISDWPDQKQLARKIAGCGWTEVAWRNMTFGVVALHHALRTD